MENYVALALAVTLVSLGIFTGIRQARVIRALRRPGHRPSDEAAYLRAQARRRLAMGVILLLTGLMIAGTYLSGQERRIEEIPAREQPGEGQPPQITRDEAWTYVGYWAAVFIMLMTLIGLALLDLLATRRYALAQLGRIRDEQRTLLDRDLAVYRQSKMNERNRFRATGTDSE